MNLVVISSVFLINSVMTAYISNKVFVPAANNIFDFDSNEDILEQERYARHAEDVTETVVEHVLKQLKRKHPDANKKMPNKWLQKIGQEITRILRKRSKNRQERGKKMDKKVKIHKKNDFQ